MYDGETAHFRIFKLFAVLSTITVALKLLAVAGLAVVVFLIEKIDVMPLLGELPAWLGEYGPMVVLAIFMCHGGYLLIMLIMGVSAGIKGYDKSGGTIVAMAVMMLVDDVILSGIMYLKDGGAIGMLIIIINVVLAILAITTLSLRRKVISEEKEFWD